MACRAPGELDLRTNLPRKDILASEGGGFPVFGEDASPASEVENTCVRCTGSHRRANNFSCVALNVTQLTRSSMDERLLVYCCPFTKLLHLLARDSTMFCVARAKD